MFTTYPYWDVSYLVATIFTLGSVVWCINAFFVWLPLVDPATEFSGESANGGGITAFIGATIFELGSVLLMIEAVNENRADCFGWAVEEALEEEGLIRLKKGDCAHHHANKGNVVGKGKATEGKPLSSANFDSPSSGAQMPSKAANYNCSQVKPSKVCETKSRMRNEIWKSTFS
jgi:hypothetical protein